MENIDQLKAKTLNSQVFNMYNWKRSYNDTFMWFVHGDLVERYIYTNPSLL